MRSQIASSSWGGSRYTHMVFTEQGVAMLSSVLNSNRAILLNIRIIRVFVRFLSVKVAGAEAAELYDLKMENATIIRKAAHDLMVQNHSLDAFGFDEDPGE